MLKLMWPFWAFSFGKFTQQSVVTKFGAYITILPVLFLDSNHNQRPENLVMFIILHKHSMRKTLHRQTDMLTHITAAFIMRLRQYCD